jgi:tetratricopeptide (TPR) repeat protein
VNITDGFSELILKSWKGELGFTDIISESEQLNNQGLQPLAVVLYQTWLQRNQSPYAHAIYFNLGALLSSLDQLPESESAYRKAIEIAPNFMHPRVNLGLLLERKGLIEEAIKEWEWVADHCPNDENNQPLLLGALNHLGRVHEGLKQFERAVNYLSRSLTHPFGSTRRDSSFGFFETKDLCLACLYPPSWPESAANEGAYIGISDAQCFG